MKIAFLAQPFDEKTQTRLFYVSIIFLILMFILFKVMCCNNKGIYNLFPECILWKKYHIYCPGCGGTHAVISMLHGNIIKSFLYHPFVPYVSIIYILFTSSMIVHRLSLFHKRFLLCPIHFCLGIIIIIFQFLFKNIMLLVFHLSIL